MGDMGKMPTGTRKIAKQRDAPISRVQPRADYVLEAARLVDARRRVLEFRCQLAGQADRRIVEGFATGEDCIGGSGGVLDDGIKFVILPMRPNYAFVSHSFTAAL